MTLPTCDRTHGKQVNNDDPKSFFFSSIARQSDVGDGGDDEAVPLERALIFKLKYILFCFSVPKHAGC